MGSRLRVALAALLCVLFATAAHLFHLEAVERSRTASESDVPVLLLPDATAVRWGALGQRTTAADLYFLRLVQYVGTPSAEAAGWPQLLPLAELITDLDPEFGYAYETAGVLLSSKHRPDESDRILEKGMAAVPGRWQLPFFASYNHWYLREDYEAGARLLLRAAGIPGSPAYLSKLAARLYSSAGKLNAGLAYVDTMLGQELPENLRKELAKRRLELVAEQDLQTLEAAIAAYRTREGTLPGLLAELVGTELSRVPDAPDGSVYSYDPITGEVGSLLLPKRLRYTRPESVPNFVAIPK